MLLALVVLAAGGGQPASTEQGVAREGAAPADADAGALRPEDHASGTEGKAPPPGSIVTPTNTTSQLWPHTSRTRSPDGRTLGINVIVKGSPERTRRVLVDRSGANWSAVEGDQNVSVEARESPYRRARGAARFTYVVPDDESTGQWVDANYQLGVGTYLGDRVHVRAYPAPSKDWTALQAHTEYWDWYRLRHTVTGVEPAARFVEADLEREPYIRDAGADHRDGDGATGSGYVVVVEFAAAAALAAAVVRERDVAPADVLLPVAVVSIVFGVRIVGVVVETLAPGVPPKAFVVVLYPILVVGPPLAVRELAEERPGLRTAVIAATALAIAILLDAVVLDVVDPPGRLVRHRIALVIAFGLLAGGVASHDRETIVVGTLAYLTMLAAPLFGFV